MHKRLIILFITVCMIVSVLPSCTKKKEDDSKTNQNNVVKKTEVEFWLLNYGAHRTKHMEKVVAAFNAQSNEIRVKHQIISPTDQTTITGYDGKLLPAIVAGTAPDVICTSPNHHVLVAEGIIQEITPYIEKDKSFNMDQFYEQKVLDCYYNEKLYSLPFQLDINGFLVWNEDLYKKAGLDPKDQPKTLDQLDAMAEKMFILNDQGLYDTVGYVPWTWLNSWSENYIFNIKYNNPDGSPNVLNDRAIAAYKWIDKYVQKYGYEKVNNSLGRIGTEISTGKLGMQYAWIEELNELRNTKVSFNWSIGPFPKAFPDAEPLWLGGHFLSLTIDSKAPAEAVEFMKFFCGVQGAEVIMNSYLGEYDELTITHPNKIVTEKYVERMPEKYRLLITDILPQMIVNRKEKLVAPAAYKKLLSDHREAVFKSKGEASALLNDLQKKMEFEWTQWQEKKQ